jgi:thiol-disulfide isomerase/thioredoxin
MGVWCSDSRELVPAFLKVMDMWHFNHQLIEMILVDHNKNAPVRGFKKLHINYIPTIIFFNQKGREIGRIVETVPYTIEAEIKAILSRYYQATQMEPLELK